MPVIEIEYFRADTFVHRLHPFTKIIFEIVVFVTAAVINDPLYSVIIILAIIGIINLAQIPVRKFRYMWVVLYVVLFLVFTQGIWFTSFGDFGDLEVGFAWKTLFYVWPEWLPGGPRVPFVLQGAVYGFALGLRFVVISLAFPLLIIATHPSDLVTSLASFRIGSWKLSYNLIFVFATALRYIPSISREFDNTIDAQRSRGVDFGGLNLYKKIKASVPLFIPVLISSMLHAQDLTLALETRAFGALEERTFLREVRWKRSDWFVSIILILLCAACVLAVTKYDLGTLPYTPQRSF